MLTYDWTKNGEQVSPSRPISLGRRYSNVRYVEQTGDLLGAEMLLFSCGPGDSGILTFYEGYWDEPVLRPLLMTRIKKRSNAEFEFQLEMEGSRGTYRASMLKSSLSLIRTDIPVANSKSAVKLLLQRTFLPVTDPK